MLAHPYGYPQIMSSFHFSDYDQGALPRTACHLRIPQVKSRRVRKHFHVNARVAPGVCPRL